MLKQSYFFSLMLTLTLLISSSAFTSQVTVSIPNLSTTPGATEILVPVNVTDVTGLNVISADLIIRYDDAVLAAKGATSDGTITSGSNVQPNPEYAIDQIKVGITRTESFSGSGVLVFIIFDVISTDPSDSTSLDILKAELNEKEVTVETSNGDISLPVTLSSFIALADMKTEDVILTWQVESEIDNLGFAIYRSERKGGTYTEIGWVESKGDTHSTRRYQFVDETAQKGKDYLYLLEFIDLTGERKRTSAIQFNWSKTIQLITTWGKLKRSR